MTLNYAEYAVLRAARQVMTPAEHADAERLAREADAGSAAACERLLEMCERVLRGGVIEAREQL